MADTVDTELGQATDTPAQEQPQPHPALRALDVLVGTWRMSGPDVHGQVSFEWLEGGFYLVQRVDINHAGNDIRGLEYIGYDPAADNLHSYFFGNTGPGPFGTIALEYVWEVADARSRSGAARSAPRRTSRALSATTTTPSPEAGTGPAAGTTRR